MVSVFDSPADWRGPELSPTDWIRPLTPGQTAEIDAALRHVERRGLALADMRKEDFPIPDFARDLAAMRSELQFGPGIQMYRGFPVRNYTKKQLRAIYWGLALHLGVPLTQSRHGDVLGDVRQLGTGMHEFAGRAYTSNEELHFHCDPCDVVGLFALRVARRGGMTKAASVVAIHNEMARTAPDLLAALYEPVVYSWRNNQLPGTAPDYEHPVFAIVDGRFVSKYSPSYIEWGYKMRGIEMPQEVKAALAMINRLANDPAFHLEKHFEPGDIQFVNNLTMLHARTEFEDFEDPEEKRHLLRLWLAVPDSARMPDSFAAFYGDVRAGAIRGGYPSTAPITFETVNIN
jgi:hypothetical protein